MESPVKNIQKSTVVLRLERNQKDVGQLRSKLNSYKCEPKTYSLFERVESLKRGLEKLSNTNREIIEALKEHKKSVEDYAESVKQQFIEFHELHKGVEEYVQGARGH